MQAKTKGSLRFIALVIAIAAGFIAALTQLQGGHGLNATYYNSPDDAAAHLTRVEEVALVSSNDNVIKPTDPFRIEWDGYIWSNRPQDYEFNAKSRRNSTRKLKASSAIPSSHQKVRCCRQ